MHPIQQESVFYLRILLHKIQGLLRIDRIVYTTYRETCEKRRRPEDVIPWDSTFSDGSVSHTTKRIRSLFATVIKTCRVSNPHCLWNKLKDNLSEDILHQEQLRYHNIINYY